MRSCLCLFFSFCLSVAFTGASASGQDAKRLDLRQEESQDYFRKWLEEDVSLIVTDEEREVFLRLATGEEKERFIEEFWRRRDPDPRTALNEFKEEHYRRIAYANEHFSSGFKGWKTDRGRLYIIHGPPDEIERHPSGGGYERPFHEGGGATATYPFEIWRYRHLEGIGSGVELEFVDKTWTEDYRLAVSADEKDVFFHIPGHGATLAEQLGMADRLARHQLRMSGARRELYPMMHHRIQDSVFARYETYARAGAPVRINHDDLKQVIRVQLSYNDLPFQAREDYFNLNQDQVLVPVTLEFPNRELTLALEDGLHKARIALYGVLTSMTNQVVTEFEDNIFTAFPPEEFERGLKGRTVYQRFLVLPKRMRYKLELVAKDVGGGKVGVVRRGIAPPSYDPPGLSASSLIFADYIERLEQVPSGETMFLLGDIKVRPNLGKAFPQGGVLGVYLQVYNAAMDQSHLLPVLSVTYRISRDGKPLLEVVDPSGSSVQVHADRRVVLVKGLPLGTLEEGRHRVEVQVHDQIKNETLTVADDFVIVSSNR